MLQALETDISRSFAALRISQSAKAAAGTDAADAAPDKAAASEDKEENGAEPPQTKDDLDYKVRRCPAPVSSPSLFLPRLRRGCPQEGLRVCTGCAEVFVVRPHSVLVSPRVVGSRDFWWWRCLACDFGLVEIMSNSSHVWHHDNWRCASAADEGAGLLSFFSRMYSLSLIQYNIRCSLMGRRRGSWISAARGPPAWISASPSRR